MKTITMLVAALATMTAFANERVDIAKTYEGKYELRAELANDTKHACAPELKIKYWESDKLLDLQFINPFEGITFVNLSPVTREFLENTYAFDVINKVNISENEKYKTVTRINTTRIEERTYKGKPDKYKIQTQTFLSQNIFNGDVRFEFINKKNDKKECLYSLK